MDEMNIRRAIAAFTAALDLRSSREERWKCLLARSVAYSHVKDFKASLKDAEAAIELLPDHYKVKAHLSHFFIQRRDTLGHLSFSKSGMSREHTKVYTGRTV